VETVQPGFLFGDTDETRCQDDGVWPDVRALAIWLKRRIGSAVGFRRFVYDPVKGKTYLDPGWVYYRGTVIPKEDVLSGKAERDDPRFPATVILKSNVKDNDWDCLWIATYRKAWPFMRDKDVFVQTKEQL
jgi:hypothetical protein